MVSYGDGKIFIVVENHYLDRNLPPLTENIPLETLCKTHLTHRIASAKLAHKCFSCKFCAGHGMSVIKIKIQIFSV